MQQRNEFLLEVAALTLTKACLELAIETNNNDASLPKLELKESVKGKFIVWIDTTNSRLVLQSLRMLRTYGLTIIDLEVLYSQTRISIEGA